MRSIIFYQKLTFLSIMLSIMLSGNFISKGQTINTDNFWGIYFSDTVKVTPRLGYIYLIGIGRSGVNIKKIGIESRDTSETFSSPNKQLTKTFKYVLKKRISEKIIHEATLKNSSKFNQYDIVDKEKESELLRVSFDEEFMIVSSSQISDIPITSKLYKRISYYPDGKTQYRGSYKNGKKDGDWFLYNEDGEMTIKKFNNGVEIR